MYKMSLPPNFVGVTPNLSLYYKSSGFNDSSINLVPSSHASYVLISNVNLSDSSANLTLDVSCGIMMFSETGANNSHVDTLNIMLNNGDSIVFTDSGLTSNSYWADGTVHVFRITSASGTYLNKQGYVVATTGSGPTAGRRTLAFYFGNSLEYPNSSSFRFLQG